MSRGLRSLCPPNYYYNHYRQPEGLSRARFSFTKKDITGIRSWQSWCFHSPAHTHTSLPPTLLYLTISLSLSVSFSASLCLSLSLSLLFHPFLLLPDLNISRSFAHNFLFSQLSLSFPITTFLSFFFQHPSISQRVCLWFFFSAWQYLPVSVWLSLPLLAFLFLLYAYLSVYLSSYLSLSHTHIHYSTSQCLR